MRPSGSPAANSEPAARSGLFWKIHTVGRNVDTRGACRALPVSTAVRKLWHARRPAYSSEPEGGERGFSSAVTSSNDTPMELSP